VRLPGDARISHVTALFDSSYGNNYVYFFDNKSNKMYYWTDSVYSKPSDNRETNLILPQGVRISHMAALFDEPNPHVPAYQRVYFLGDKPDVMYRWSSQSLDQYATQKFNIEGLKKDGGNKVSDALAKRESAAEQKPGGIDFREIAMKTKPMGMFERLSFDFSAFSGKIMSAKDIEREITSVTKMANAGMLPSAHRVKALVAACCSNGEKQKYQEPLMACLAQICQVEEQKCQASDPELLESLVVVDAMTPVS
jgi:hypothetical protein